METPTRRSILAAGAAGLAAGLAGLPAAALPAAALADPQAAAPSTGPRRRSLRIAHLTNIHVQPEKNAGPGMAQALRHVQAQADRPDVVFLGGDLIMDAFGADRARTQTQWDLFARVLKDENSLPVEACIGNHDVWSFRDREGEDDAREGKKWAMDVLGLERPYRSFDRAGWHFVVLDSTFPRDNGYVARLDDEQFEWLTEDLARTPEGTPVLVFSHIPILSASAYFDGDNEKSGNWQVPGAWMHIDARRIKDLFVKHPNVKAAISGHIHLVDRTDYLGVSYFCNGAVSGGWWGGNYQECAPGYALVDLYADGTVENRYVEWGWKPA